MSEQRCIITDEPITRENDSRAHVIPSALGGRLKPWGILSKGANALLGDKVDLPLIRSFQDIMSLLNGSRDRGENQPAKMTDDSGREYIVQFGEPLKATTPSYHETLCVDGLKIQINARNLKEAKTLLGRVKAKHPDFDVNEALKHAIRKQSWPDGMLKSQLQIGPHSIFPALFTSASIFAVHCRYPPHPELRNYVDRFDPDKPEMPRDTFYFIPSQKWVSASAEVTHIIALLASAEKQQVLIYFELFNAVQVAIVIPYAGHEDACHTYAVNVLDGTEVNATVQEEAIRKMPWQETHRLGDQYLYDFTASRIGKLVNLSYKRAMNAEIETLMKHAFGDDEDPPLTSKDIVDGVDKIADFIAVQWERPTHTIEQMEAEFLKFRQFYFGIELLLTGSKKRDCLQNLETKLEKLRLKR